MARYIIHAPNTQYLGSIGSTRFERGVAESDSDAVAAYCRAAGYDVEDTGNGDSAPDESSPASESTETVNVPEEPTASPEGAPETSPEDAPEESDPIPTDADTNATIKAYADKHGIDIDGATKKADMLAAINKAV